MAGMYFGVGNVARKVKNGYAGVTNVARKIKYGYVGVANVARKFYSAAETVYLYNSGVWTLATGFTNVSRELATTKYEDGTVVSNEKHLTFWIQKDDPSNNNYPTARLNPAIDLTDYQYICVYIPYTELQGSSSRWILGIDTNSQLPNAHDTSYYKTFTDIAGGTTIKLDVSDKTGKYYIFIEWGYTGGGDGVIVGSNVSQIYITPLA